MGRKKQFKGICLRCGEPYSYIKRNRVGNRTYLYAVHYIGKVNGKRKYRFCYLGVEGEYVYVSKLHQDIGITLKGLKDKNRAIEYLIALLKNVLQQYRAGKISKQQLIELKPYIDKLKKTVNGLLEKQTSIEKGEKHG